MWAIAVKELRQLRRDRRTLAMLILMPLLLLVIFGYAASFDVSRIPTLVVGPGAERAAQALHAPFDAVAVHPAQGRADAESALRDGQVAAAFVTGSGGACTGDGACPTAVLVDGSQLFTARSAEAAVQRLPGAHAEVLFNPELRTSTVMVPALIGLVLVFVGTLATSLGVVRERQAGTLEQLAVMPFRPRDVFLGKVLPYFAVATLDMVVIAVAGLLLFDVPFRGSVLTFALGVVLFLFVTLGLGVLISTVSENQGQAIQLAIMTLLPQVLLSGMVFPLSSMAAGVRWIAYVLPLTYFIEIARGVLVRGTSLTALWFPLLMLAVLGSVVFAVSLVRFRRDLAPPARGGGEAAPQPRPAAVAGAR